MERRRIIFAAGLALVLSAALLPLVSHAKAQSICCNDVKFPERYSEGYGPSKYIVVDGIGHAPGTYRTIQDGIDHVLPNGVVLVKPNEEAADGGVYRLGKPLFIGRPVTISSFGGSGIVRIRTRQGGEFDEQGYLWGAKSASCAVVDLRGDGKVRINGLSFEVASKGGACIAVEHAGEFVLTASDITAIDDGDGELAGQWCAPSSSGPRPRMNCGLVGVLVESGVATIQGNRIRRTGTAVALVNAAGEAHKIVANYIAGNGVGVYADGGTRFVINGNGIFRNHNFGVNLAEASGTVADNDIEDNWTGLKILPPSAFSATAFGPDGAVASSYSDMGRALIRIERNLVTQYGVYRPNGYDVYHDNGSDKVTDSTTSERGARYGYAIDFALDASYINDNVYDYPKRGSILSGVVVEGNCFFGPATSLFDRDRFTRVIAPNAPSDDQNTSDNDESTKSGDHRPWWYIFGGDKAAYRNNSHSSGYKDALTPLWFSDSNTWVEHLDYDAVDKIDHENAIRSPLTDAFHGGLMKAIHNWFARNKREMTCGGSPVVSAPGDWPRFDTNPIR